MCGIAGFVSRHSHREPVQAREVLERMCRVIAHRGPDEQGVYVQDEVALGMRRLSIIDVAGGHQPMSGCEDRQTTIVFNGEIYNYRDLQRELESRGHRFHTHSDTETIVHAYEEFGVRCVDHLRGMFAFAIWDGRSRQLFVARDRVGKKPLYYTITRRGSLIFGSELKSLREHPEFTGELSLEALDAYVSFGYVPDPLTIFGEVQKLPPGHYLMFRDGQANLEQYWDFPYAQPQTNPATARECLDELQSLLDEAVRLRLESEVPLGAFLSGGIDSSTVVGLMSRHATQPVKTFSIGFHEDSYNELKYARLTAQKFGTDHHEFVVTPDVCAIVDELVWHFDEPFADSSAIPTYMVSKLAREHVTVALSGDGGDELFAGYTRYAIDRRRSGFGRLPRVVRQGLMQPLGRNLPHGSPGRNYLHAVALDPIDRYLEHISVFTRLNKPSLYTEAFQKQLGSREAARAFREIAMRSRAADPLDPLLYLDSKTYLPGDILTKVDRMSMAVSLEARTPLLDHKLIEFVCTRIPANLKMKGLETKHIFKQAVRNLVPQEILDRPKQGFGIPIDRWINRELRQRIRETLTSSSSRQRGYFDPRYIDVLLDEHERGRRDHSTPLWALFIFELWQQRYVDAAAREPQLAYA